MAHPPVRTVLDKQPAPVFGWVYERLAPRVPWIARLLARLASRLPRTSRLRQRLHGQLAFINFGAFGRGDVELQLLVYHPRVELRTNPEFVSVGLKERYHGREGLRALIADWHDTWADLTMEPIERYDFGECVLVTYRLNGTGRLSGAEADMEAATVVRTAPADGRVIDQEFFAPSEAAFDSVGFPAPR